MRSEGDIDVSGMSSPAYPAKELWASNVPSVASVAAPTLPILAVGVV